MQGSSDRGLLVSRGAANKHQLLGVDSSNTSCASLCQRSIGDRNSFTAGQSDSSGLYQPPGWHGVPAASKAGKNPLVVGSSTRHHLVCSAHSRGDQAGGRCGIQNDSRSSGLEAISGGFPEDQCHLGSPGSRSFCLTPLLSTGLVLQLEIRPSSTSNQCFSTGLGASEGLRQPPLVPSRESSEAGESPTGSGHTGGSRVEGSTMVPSSSRDAVGLSLVDPVVPRSVS